MKFPTMYKVPFEMDVDTEDIYINVPKAAQKHNIKVECSLPLNAGPTYVIGTKDQLINFFSELNDSAQSFPVTEFVEYIQDFIIQN